VKTLNAGEALLLRGEFDARTFGTFLFSVSEAALSHQRRYRFRRTCGLTIFGREDPSVPPVELRFELEFGR
jgi:hypothetical protein